MIKRLLYIVTIIFISTANIYSQEDARLLSSENDKTLYWVNTVPFYNIPGAKVGEYYSHQIEFRIPKDTISSIADKVMQVKLKELQIISVNDIPNGLSYSQSIVDNSDESYFHIYLDIYGRLQSEINKSVSIDLSATLSVNNGKSVVRTNRISNIIFRKLEPGEGLETYQGNVGLKSLRYYPSPIANRTEVSFWSSKLQLVQFEVRDAIGNLKYKKQFTAKMGSNTISFSQDELPNGLYIYSIRTENQILAKRLIVN